MTKKILKIKKVFLILTSILLVGELSFSPLISSFLEKPFNGKGGIAFAQTPPTIPSYSYPRSPRRFIDYLSNIENVTDDLVNLNNKLKDLLSYSDCKYAISQCIPSTPSMGITSQGKTTCIGGKVLGQPYQNPEKIKKYKEEIKNKIDTLSYQRKLLKKELSSDVLNCEFKSLRPEISNKLKNEISEVLNDSKNIVTKANTTENLYSKDYSKKCNVSCTQNVCGFSSCFQLGVGPQKNIDINVKIGIKLKDLKLGKIGIDKFKMALPNKLKFSKLGDIVINIPAQTIPICPSSNSSNLSVNPPNLTHLPNLSFTCPSFNYPELPKIPTFKLLEKIVIPSFQAHGPDWCQAITSIFSNTLSNVSNFQRKTDQEISSLRNNLDKKIGEIESQIEKDKLKIENATSEAEKESIQKEIDNLETEKNDLQVQGNTAINQIQNKGNKIASPTETDFIGQSSNEFNYQASTNLPINDLSLSYQCSQQGTTANKVDSNIADSWYFARLNWLMKKCADLPEMKGTWGLKQKAEDCYNPQKVVKTILKECKKYWRKHSNIPKICREIRYSYNITDPKISAATQCQYLFKAKGEKIPSNCIFDVYQNNNKKKPKLVSAIRCRKTFHKKNCLFEAYDNNKQIVTYLPSFKPIEILKNKCHQIEYEKKSEPSEQCKLLPLFTGKIESPTSDIYSPSNSSSCLAQKLLNLPLGFGGGANLNCPMGISNPPKIHLPDIVIPDIILPSFGISPFFKIKLPSIITEDLRLPDIDLCNLDQCSNIFPSLSFKALNLNLPSFDLSVPIPNLNTQIGGRVNFPPIRFSLPSLNSFNFVAPEISLPKINLPHPKITFAITGIDTGAIFSLIYTFILNALGAPTFGGCLSFKFPSLFLSIIFPDYYFSFKKFPEIPKNNYCSDINGFCKDVKNSLGENGWIKKAERIENIVNEKISVIQKRLNSSKTISQDIQNEINEIFKKYYTPIINEKISKYVNPQTKTLNVDNAPFPGVFPSGKNGEKCLAVPLPEKNIILRFVPSSKMPIKRIEEQGNDTIIYTPLDIPSEIPIPWPNDLKDINLTHPIGYTIPPIPLSKLSYEKEFSIKGPGFQPYTFTFNFGPSSGDCVSKPPSGGNPVPIDQIDSQIDKIKDFQSKLKNASQTIKNILE